MTAVRYMVCYKQLFAQKNLQFVSVILQESRLGIPEKVFDVQTHNFPVTGHSIFSTEISSNLVA